MASLAKKDDMYETPDYMLLDIEGLTNLHFDFDVCANSWNRKFLDYYGEQSDALSDHSPWLLYNGDGTTKTLFCNPPRSKNGKFVNKAYSEWNNGNFDLVMLLCWNDLGNKYGEKLFPHILDGTIQVGNLGKIKFCKNTIISEFPSRLTYMWAWFKKVL